MKRETRLSIGLLMGLIFLLAIGFTLLLTPTIRGAQASFSFTVLILLAVALRASQPPRSEFARGFVLFGGAYFVLMFSELFANWGRALSLTTPFLRSTYNYGARSRGWETLGDLNALGFWPMRFDMQPTTNEFTRFETIGHSFFALGFGIVGGMLSLYFARAKGREA